LFLLGGLWVQAAEPDAETARWWIRQVPSSGFVPAGDLDGSQVAAMDAETLKGYVLSDLQVTVKLFKKMNSVYFNLNL
jgi:hypothetical protein